MRVGFNKQEITPTKSMEMCGYAGNRLSQGVADPLWVKALVFEQDAGLMGLLSYDLLAVDSYLKTQIQKQLTNSMELVLFATHTHQGPNRIIKSPFKSLFLEIDEPYHELLVDQSVRALKEAVAALETFDLSYGKNQVHGLYSNRHDLNHFFNPWLDVVKLVTPTQVLGLISFSCHPTILKEDHVLFSKDLIAGIDAHLFGYDEWFFINGTAGDVSTRFLRTSSDQLQVNRTGRLLANIIMATDTRPVPMVDNIMLSTRIFALATKEPRAISEIEKEERQLQQNLVSVQDLIERRQLETKIQGLQVEAEMQEFLIKNRDVNLEVHIIDFGVFKVVTFPLEVFSILALDILKYHRQVIVASYVDGYFGYLVDEASYKARVYEAHSSVFRPLEAERLFEQVLAWLNETGNED